MPAMGAALAPYLPPPPAARRRVAGATRRPSPSCSSVTGSAHARRPRESLSLSLANRTEAVDFLIRTAGHVVSEQPACSAKGVGSNCATTWQSSSRRGTVETTASSCGASTSSSSPSGRSRESERGLAAHRPRRASRRRRTRATRRRRCRVVCESARPERRSARWPRPARHAAAAMRHWIAAVIAAIERELALATTGRSQLLVMRASGTWFHATFAENRESIMRHGLDWRRMAGGGIAGSVEAEWPGVFVCADLEDAKAFFAGHGTPGSRGHLGGRAGRRLAGGRSGRRRRRQRLLDDLPTTDRAKPAAPRRKGSGSETLTGRLARRHDREPDRVGADRDRDLHR